MSFFERRYAPIGNTFVEARAPKVHHLRSRSVPACVRFADTAKDKPVVWPDTDSDCEWDTIRSRRNAVTCDAWRGAETLQSNVSRTVSTVDTLGDSRCTGLETMDDTGAVRPCSDDDDEAFIGHHAGQQTSATRPSAQCLRPQAERQSGSGISAPAAARTSQVFAADALQIRLDTAVPRSEAASSSQGYTPSACSDDSRQELVPVCLAVLNCGFFVPPSQPSRTAEQQELGVSKATTVMIRNVPRHVTQQELLEELNRSGFAGQYDFLYMPCDFHTEENQGMAFVNFTSAIMAASLIRQWHQQSSFSGGGPSLTVAWASVQGLEANLKASGARLRRIKNPRLRPFILSSAIAEAVQHPSLVVPTRTQVQRSLAGGREARRELRGGESSQSRGSGGGQRRGAAPLVRTTPAGMRVS